MMTCGQGNRRREAGPFAQRSTGGPFRKSVRRCFGHLGGMGIRHIATALLFSTGLLSLAQGRIDLHASVVRNGIELYNRELTLVDEPGHQGIRLSKAYGEGVAWFMGVTFSEGIIEFDVRGEDVKQHSFVGIAFHGANDTTFDAVYLRPFQFRATADSLRNRMLQYISLPVHTWRALRKSAPGVNEHSITPAPDPSGWVHMRIVVSGDTISTFINGAKEPSLVVKKLTKLRTGRVGFYVADTSGGDFANIRMTALE